MPQVSEMAVPVDRPRGPEDGHLLRGLSDDAEKAHPRGLQTTTASDELMACNHVQHHQHCPFQDFRTDRFR